MKILIILFACASLWGQSTAQKCYDHPCVCVDEKGLLISRSAPCHVVGVEMPGYEQSPTTTKIDDWNLTLSNAPVTLVSIKLAPQEPQPDLCAGKPLCVQSPAETPWAHVLDKATAWTFTVDGKQYEIDGATLARIVKAIGEPK